ncbi:MAG: hypothetical protein JSV56_08510 [Methanomassiliicoccales archaeon]|nr:MAG: hypothetical protein JSV56_08510 [Methanomassiliicoccales archaeon]
MSQETILRKCVVCGKKLEIILHGEHKYEGGHYFGKFEIPIGEGENKVIGESDIFGKREIVKIVEWTGESKEVEYWECDDCYYE